MKKLIIVLLVGILTIVSIAISVLNINTDPRVCGNSKDTIQTFKLLYACPTTGASYDAICPDWELDYIIPLELGGCKIVSNLQWLPTSMYKEKKKWENDIYDY
jgi:hypothetical protein